MVKATHNQSVSSAATGYTLTLRPGRSWQDTACLRPQVTSELSLEQVNAKFGDAFEITGTPGDTLTLHGLPALGGIGAHMTSGTLIIHGQAGDDLGAAMTGGTIHVHGGAGDRIGGPALEQFNDVRGPISNADADGTSNQTSNNRTGALGRRGMNGGTIVVHGNAGDYAGLRMRRGLIAIKGHAGKSPGYRMLAGTVVVGRGDLQQPGLEMQRGTIVSLAPDAIMHADPYFETDGVFNGQGLSVIGLMLTQLGKLGFEITRAMRDGQWRLSSGDRHELGKGELWQWMH